MSVPRHRRTGIPLFCLAEKKQLENPLRVFHDTSLGNGRQLLLPCARGMVAVQATKTPITVTAPFLDSPRICFRVS